MENKNRILIVDDEFILREQAEASILHLIPDCEFVQCATLEEAIRALEQAKTENRPFRVVTTDYNLTEGGGEGARVSQAVHMNCPDAILMVVSAEVENDLKNLVSFCNADAYLAKPYNSGQFTIAYKKALDNKLAHAA